MNYSPKLKKAAEEIKAVLKNYDIAGIVTLHTPGFSEYLFHITPSYSCAKVETDAIRIRAKLIDFKGDKQKQKQVLTDTSNMFNLLSETTFRMNFQLTACSDALDKQVNAEHGNGNHTSHNSQNN